MIAAQASSITCDVFIAILWVNGNCMCSYTTTSNRFLCFLCPLLKQVTCRDNFSGICLCPSHFYIIQCNLKKSNNKKLDLWDCKFSQISITFDLNQFLLTGMYDPYIKLIQVINIHVWRVALTMWPFWITRNVACVCDLFVSFDKNSYLVPLIFMLRSWPLTL